MFCLSCWVCFYSADSHGSKIRAPDYSARWRFGSGWIDDGADFRNSVRGKAEAEAQQPGTSMVLVKAIKGGSDLLYDSFYLFHRTLRFPVTKLTIDELHGLGQRLLFSASALNAIFRLFKKSIENFFFVSPRCRRQRRRDSQMHGRSRSAWCSFPVCSF